MEMIIRIADHQKVLSKIKICRENNMSITENFIAGTITVKYDEDLVMKCARKGPDKWEIAYNVNFWEEALVTDHLHSMA